MFCTPLSYASLERELARRHYTGQLYEEELARRAYYAEAAASQRAYDEAVRREEQYRRQQAEAYALALRHEEHRRQLAAAEARRGQLRQSTPHYVVVPVQSSAPAPVRPSAAEQHRAAVVIQRVFRAHLADRRAAAEHLERLAGLRRELNEVVDAFALPERLEFDDAGKLTYAPVNAAVHAYEDRLTRLLTRLDSVESGGSAVVRAARKAVVRDIDAALDAVDRAKADQLRAAREPSPVTKIEIPIMDGSVDAPTEKTVDDKVDEVQPGDAQPVADAAPAVVGEDTAAEDAAAMAIDDAASAPSPAPAAEAIVDDDDDDARSTTSTATLLDAAPAAADTDMAEDFVELPDHSDDEDDYVTVGDGTEQA